MKAILGISALSSSAHVSSLPRARVNWDITGRMTPESVGQRQVEKSMWGNTL
jgi:hypothetical protein